MTFLESSPWTKTQQPASLHHHTNAFQRSEAFAHQLPNQLSPVDRFFFQGTVDPILHNQPINRLPQKISQNSALPRQTQRASRITPRSPNHFLHHPPYLPPDKPPPFQVPKNPPLFRARREMTKLDRPFFS